MVKQASRAYRWMALLAIVLLAGSCSKEPAEPVADVEERSALDVVRMNYMPYLSFGPVLIALEEGFFAEQNIEIDFVSLKRSAQGVAPAAAGKLDVLAGGINAGFFNVTIRGADIRMVADKGHVSDGPPPVSAYLAKPELIERGRLEEAATWKEIRISTSKDNFEGFAITKLVSRFGLGVMDLHTLDLPSSALLDAAEKGKVQVLHASEPWLTRLLSAGHVKIWKPDYELIPGQQFAYISFGPTILKDRREVGTRFLVAYLKGVRRYNEGKTERNVDIIEKHTKLDREIVKKAKWASIRNDGRIDVESVLAFHEWAVETGMIERKMAPEEFWDPSFVDEANRILDRGPSKE